MATLSTSRASYARPVVHIGNRASRSVISQIDRNNLADAINCLSHAVTATTDTSLDCNISEAYRLIRKALLSRKSRNL